MAEPTIGQWVRITSGVHAGKEGVIDLIEDFLSGTVYRVTNPRTKVCHGRFHLNQFKVIAAPKVTSQLPVEVQQQAMNLLTNKKVVLT